MGVFVLADQLNLFSKRISVLVMKRYRDPILVFEYFSN